MASSPRPIVVLGAGYGGITATLRLAKLFKNHPDYQVHLVDRHPYHLLETRLHEAAARRAEVTVPILGLLKKRKVIFHLAEILKIDLESKKVICLDQEIPYHYLVIALGSKTNFYDIPGLKEYALELKSFHDTLKIRDQIERMFAKAAGIADPVQRKPYLTFVIGGGGLTGVELAAELSEFIEELSLRYRMNPSDSNLILIEVSSSILPNLNENLIQRTKRELIEKRVKTLESTRVMEMKPGLVIIQPGQPIQAHTLIWTGGIRISSLMQASGLETGPLGKIVVDEFLQVKNYPQVYAIGDNALAINPKTRHPVPAAAQFALQQGRLVANNIYAEVAGKPRKPYKPKVLGEVISLGRHLSVGWLALPGERRLGFIGFLASLLKRAIAERHLLLLWKESRNWSRAQRY
jgi:NADH:ubiquinone reductase (H+-translocating)